MERWILTIRKWTNKKMQFKQKGRAITNLVECLNKVYIAV